MTKINSFEDLEVWKIAVELARIIYELLRTFPPEERYGLISQTQDSVVSISGNIAEGFGRFHFKDKIRFYYNGRGSLLESKSHLLVAKALGYINQSNQELYEKAMKLIHTEGIKLNNYISNVGKQ